MPKSFIKPWKFILFSASCMVFLLLAWLAVCAFSVQTIRIAVGPEGGAYASTAHRYAEILGKRGYSVELVHYDNTDEIAGNVNDPGSDIDAGFSALNLDSKEYRHLVSLGAIETQPVFIFSRNTAYRRGIHTFADLRGTGIVLPPEHSVTSQAVLEILQKFRVDRQNTKITFLPLKDAVAQLRSGHFDAGVFILSADNPYILDLAVNAELTMSSVGDIDSLVKKFPFLHRAVLPAGIYDLERTVPAADVPLIATNISVVAKKTMRPASVYALLEAMSEAHRRATYVSRPGEFPSYAGGDLPVHPLVPDFYRSGTPWIFANLPPGLANLIDRYLVALLACWFLVGLRTRFEEALGLREYLGQVCCGFALKRMDAALSRGRELDEVERWLLQRIARWVNREGKPIDLKQLLDKVAAADSAAVPTSGTSVAQPVLPTMEQG